MTRTSLGELPDDRAGPGGIGDCFLLILAYSILSMTCPTSEEPTRTTSNAANRPDDLQGHNDLSSMFPTDQIPGIGA